MSAATPQEEIEAKVPAAKAIIDAWQGKDPKKAQRKLHVVLWTPNDREPAPRYRERLTAALHDIREYYAREMTRLGFGPMAPNFDYDTDGLVKIHVVTGRGPHSNYRTESGGQIRTECLPVLRAEGIDPDKETLVIFCNMATWDEEKRTISQNSPYYAGGTHRNGTAWQVDSPIIDIDLIDKHEPKVRDGQYGEISIGRYNSIFIGGICHELGHAFGLPHNRERPDEREVFGTALMGSGNRSYGEERRGEGRGSFLTLAHGLRLATHPLFCGSVKGMDIRANAEPSGLTIEQKGKGFTFSGKVTADPPVYAVVAYMDPEGGGDYDATTASAVPDADGRFTLHCPGEALAPGKAAELRVVYLQANGVASGFLSATPFRYPYTVDAEGRADISAMRTKLLLKPLVDAVNRRDSAEAARLAASPKIAGDELLAEVSKRLIATMEPKTMDAVPAETKQVALSDLTAAETNVGWGRPVRDRTPDAAALLVSGGRIYRHGLYAHAPARHVWDLDGSWKTLTGHAGVADGHGGSVRFHIEGDGKTLWQTNVVKEGAGRNFKVDVSGVKQLVLRADDGGDGNSFDWSFWLEPTLSR